MNPNAEFLGIQVTSEWRTKKHHRLLEVASGTQGHCFVIAAQVLPTSVCRVHMYVSHNAMRKVMLGFCVTLTLTEGCIGIIYLFWDTEDTKISESHS